MGRAREGVKVLHCPRTSDEGLNASHDNADLRARTPLKAHARNSSEGKARLLSSNRYRKLGKVTFINKNVIKTPMKTKPEISSTEDH